MALVVALKAVMDIVVAPPWARTWYSTSQRVAIAFAVGAASVIAARFLYRRVPPVGVCAAGVLVLLMLPTNAGDVASAASRPDTYITWQREIDRAADWIAEARLGGRLGARDAGLLGYRLDHEVVNLDGLVNDYEFTTLDARNASVPDRVRATGVDIYVNRMEPKELEDLECAEVLWRSPGRVPAANTAGQVTWGRIVVLDVRACRA
jgi:hypothetical protein